MKGNHAFLTVQKKMIFGKRVNFPNFQIYISFCVEMQRAKKFSVFNSFELFFKFSSK